VWGGPAGSRPLVALCEARLRRPRQWWCLWSPRRPTGDPDQGDVADQASGANRAAFYVDQGTEVIAPAPASSPSTWLAIAAAEAASLRPDRRIGRKAWCGRAGGLEPCRGHRSSGRRESRREPYQASVGISRGGLPDIGPSHPNLNDMSWLPLRPEPPQPNGHALPLGHAATDARRNTTSGTVALALVSELPLQAQGADRTRAADYQVGRGCFE